MKLNCDTGFSSEHSSSQVIVPFVAVSAAVWVLLVEFSLSVAFLPSNIVLEERSDMPLPCQRLVFKSPTLSQVDWCCTLTLFSKLFSFLFSHILAVAFRSISRLINIVIKITIWWHHADSIFTALLGMQMRSYDEISVCPSVCLSVCQTRALWQNGRKICLDFYIIRKNIYPSFLRRMVGGGRPLLPEILGQPARVGAKSPILNR